MERPRISVYVITYNQEDLICRTMNSLLQQRDFLYEICINDDCSKDKTYEILQEYQRQYPEVVKPVQNEHNLGIFANMEAVMARLTGDMVYQLSGDDVCPDGYFKAVLEYIEKEQIDWKNELFCIYGDYMEIGPDGKEIVYSNKMVENYDAIKLKIRKLLSNRSACYSKKILDKFQKVSEGRSYSAEATQDIQLAIFSEKNYYHPVLGNIYYAGIGVSSRLTSAERYQNLFEGSDRMVAFVEGHGHSIDKKDRAFIEFIKAYRTHNTTQTIYFFLKSIDLSLGFKGIGIDRIVFAIRKKWNFIF